ncbi:hypothetical protein CI1B_31130 [Bradyrhizobium ivorense]|uniref:DUF4194 domain-containing protein n=1 Tax=Bradyrhizobium ivorense TaxID=2511166 RepID=A0A508T6B2_9BRAD|nr:DUF4194 domain-containing protein [Bradyrhizobium ivorense]VIO70459.1 hypothetical protein CI1B_31130 [Bradyrhizobium ivorense]VIO79134.1 hypothetical protein CI41S_67020 [Bradyrhizobium ivorense]
MLRDLSKIIDDADSEGQDGDQLQKELRQAAQALWRTQFIYENDWGVKTSYELLRRYTGYFENLFDALGYRVVGRPNDGYVGLVANELPPRQSMKLDESLLLLVLRLHYEEAFTRFEAKEFGEVEVESEQILQIYEDRTHRERPNFGRVKEILAGFRQRGLVQIEDRDDRNFTLFLRPALPIVVSKDTLGSLEEFVSRSTAATAKTDAASEVQA